MIKRTHLRNAAGAVFIISSAAYGMNAWAQSQAETIAQNWLNQLKDMGATSATYGDLKYLPGLNELEIKDFKVSFANAADPISVIIPSMEIAGLTERGDGGYTADRWTVSSVTASFPNRNVLSMSGVSAEALVLPNFRSIKLDKAKPSGAILEFARKLEEIAAKEIRISDATMSLNIGNGRGANADVIQTTRYTNYVIRDWSNGNIAHTSIDSAMTTSPLPGSGSMMTMSYGKLISTNTNMSAYVDLLDPSRYKDGKGDNVWRPAAEYGEMNNMVVEVPNQKFKLTLDKITMKNMKVRQTKTPILPLIDKFAAMEAQGNGVKPSEDEIFSMVFQIYQAMGIDEVKLSGLNVFGPRIQTASLDNILLKNASSDGIEEISINGLDVLASDRRNNPTALKLGRFAMLGMDFPTAENFIQLIKAQMSGLRINPLNAIPTLQRVEYKDFLLQTRETQGTLSLDSMVLNMSDHIKAVPTKLDLQTQNLRVPAAMIKDRKAQGILNALGYSELVYSDKISLNWDTAASTLTISPLSYDLKNAGTLTLVGKVNGLSRAILDNPQQAQQAMFTLALDNAKLRFDNKSIVERGLKMQARQMGATPEQLKQQVGAILPGMLAMLKNPQLQQDITSQVQAFLDSPQSLTISLQPANPVALIQMGGLAQQAPDQLAKLLNLQVQANN